MTDLVSKFKTAAQSLDYIWIYGARAFINYDIHSSEITIGTIILAVFPMRDTAIQIPHGNRINRFSTSTTIWIGRKFEATTLSELDETYEQKHDRRLFELKELLVEYIETGLCGSDIELKSFIMSEQINQTDENIDFIAADIVIEHDRGYTEIEEDEDPD